VLNGYAAAVIPLIVAAQIPIVGSFVVGAILVVEKVASVLLTVALVAGWLYLTMAEPEFCMTNASGNLQALSEDNVHILQELATISGRWTPEYVHSIDHPSGLDYYTMLRGVLEPNGTAKSLLNSTYLQGALGRSKFNKLRTKSMGFPEPAFSCYEFSVRSKCRRISWRIFWS
jgi:hypothetical protein